MQTQEEPVIQARQLTFHPTETLCGKAPGNWARGETSFEIPTLGIADPNWITCPACREKLTIDWSPVAP